MAMLESKYTLKPSSIGYPKVYIRADVRKILYGDGSYVCKMNSDSYVKEGINNVNKRLKEYSLQYSKKLSDVTYFPNKPFS